MCVHSCLSYHKGDDASLCRLPFKAAVDEGSPANQHHNAALDSVEILLEQLKDTKMFLNILAVT